MVQFINLSYDTKLAMMLWFTTEHPVFPIQMFELIHYLLVSSQSTKTSFDSLYIGLSPLLNLIVGL